MSPEPVPDLGVRLREERLRRGIGVRRLARDLGVSASLISQIETGKSQPSVSTLYAITSALGISVEDVFDRAGPGPGEEGAPATVLEALGAFRGRRFGPLVPPAQRQVLSLDSGVTWERLGQLPKTHVDVQRNLLRGKLVHVDFLRITYAPGGTSSSSGMLMRHEGSEYGYLLSGELVLTLGFEEHRLQPGDAVCFESSTPHRYRNDADEPAIGVWFVVEPD